MWLALCLATSILFFGEFWAELPHLLSSGYLIENGRFYPLLLLLGCAFLLWSKRNEVLSRMRRGKSSPWGIFLGLALLGGIFALPGNNISITLFQMLLSYLGFFALLFGEAVVMPVVILGIYGFILVFPAMINGFAATPSAMATLWMVTGICSLLGFPISNQGQTIYFPSSSGSEMSIFISSGCSGVAQIGIFIALFALMMLDIRLPLGKAGGFFLLGVAGTWFLNALRITALILVGYLYGADALWGVHEYSIYIIFPFWLAGFIYIYLKAANRRVGVY